MQCNSIDKIVLYDFNNEDDDFYDLDKDDVTQILQEKNTSSLHYDSLPI